MNIDLKQIRDLLDVVSDTDITELTIEFGDQRITIKKSPQAVQTLSAEVSSQTAPPPPPKPQPISFEPTAEPQKDVSAPPSSNNGLVPVTSPMVGTFYRSPSPSAPPFVDVGDHIAVGQTVCIIEAMKLMNDMPAEISGKLVKICVENGTTVEYGQPLFLVDPKG